ncbi:MAG: hypothetical protein Q9188_002420 [Gyalolechia gomerana]
MGIGRLFTALRKPKADMATQNPSYQDRSGQGLLENGQQLISTLGQEVVPEPRRTFDINDTARSERGDHVGIRQAPHTLHLERRGRIRLPHQTADIARERHRVNSVDLDPWGDLGLQSRPAFSDDFYPINEAHLPPRSQESGYSANKQLDLTCVPKGSLGNRVQYLQSISDNHNLRHLLTEGFGENRRYVENAPCGHEYQLSGILGSVAPRPKGSRVRQQIPQSDPAPSRVSEEIPKQDSEITLCGSVASNGVYKIQESNFGKDCTFIRNIGEGGFGRIELHQHNKTSKLLVLKKTRMSFEYTNGIPTEAYILRDIIKKGHERLPYLYHFNISLAECHYWMDYCDGGDLVELSLYFLHRARRIPEGFIWHVHTQLSAATAYLHTGLLDRTHPELPPPPNWQPIVHRDIKPDNIFLKLVPGNRYPDIVLGDFGLATTTLVSGGPDKIVGTPCWQPPQIPYHTVDSDVWAAGAVIHQLALMYPPIADQPSDDSRTTVEWECDGRTRQVWNVRTRGYSLMLQETIQEWLSLEKEWRPVGLTGVLKAEGGRMIWLAEGGIEEDLDGWQGHVKRGGVEWKKRGGARGFEE